MKNQLKKIYFLVFVLPLFALQSYAQQTLISGVVTDAADKDPVPYATVLFKGTDIKTRTDADGKYTISTSEKYDQLQVSYVGYKTSYVAVEPGKSQILNIRLQSEAQSLTEVTITSNKRPAYRNKNNPAVELIRKVIENRAKNQNKNYDQVEYQQYEQMVFSLSNLSDKFKNKRIFKNYQFLFEEQDSTKIGGKLTLPVYMEEKVSQNYLQKSPEKKKTILTGDKHVNYDSKFIDTKGLSKYFERMYADINIYESNISLVSNQFLSPIADASPTFYKFFITDTIKDHQPNLIELSFIPRNNTDLLFEGKMYITMDGNYAVQDAYLTVNKNVNLNFVRALEAKLDFEKNPDGRYHLSKTNLVIDFGISKNKGGGFTGQRTVSIRDYKINQPQADTLFAGPSMVIAPKAEEQSDLFWSVQRDSSVLANTNIYKNIDTLQTIPSFKRTADLVTLLFAGYKNFGPFEVGPVNTFYSFNNVEGFRLRLGGRTTPELSKRYYFETYGAYGFKDEKWKYFFSGTYSLNNKSIYAFPQNYIRGSFQRDTKIPGQDLQFVQEDNFLLSFKRGQNNTLLYNDFYKINYVKEFENHFSYEVIARKWTQSPAGSLYYRNTVNNALNTVDQITTSELSLNLRYAPNEKFYQGKIYRVPIIDKYPIYTLRYTAGIKGVLGGEYDFHSLVGRFDKRFYLSQLGYSDVTLEGGNIFGKVPFPLMSIHRANQTYSYQLDSYNLMNFLEFVSDHYASVNIDHSFNGFFFNKIPLIKKLKLRETMSFKALYGGIRSENDPANDPSLLAFPSNSAGVASTYTLEKTPYIEGSVGISNIFKVLRVDLVKRFNYLDHPEVSEYGIRARVKFDF
ncbi:DUF5686 and carboxypeptidase regulatory-like domain-containing protein [Pedobacter sp. MC2016-14]|uniref:DUF5686 and carboxypeptidase-like regulatory domain-containing protein n=1 Tax=Pedobacter sp. MC2016-14 TaxID=2897327 RepID=UPI001E30C758|nr:DUF5686 and carboxypeptidase-like regulatory domain-containing protein [Pedobacter sp. MC2016-14]MCD0489754.1 DUF5686 and carboxypeptidase regulatory-like domain-containing protein [Pedobacter sp. MC2016-14]